jgi:HD-like signal output (HDOD) protein
VQQVPGSRIVLSPDLVATWHPKIGESVLRNWQMSESVCGAVGAQSEPAAAAVGSATLTDVLIAGMRLANRSSNLHDKTSMSAGGVLARLNLSVEACQDLIEEAETEVRALKNILAV